MGKLRTDSLHVVCEAGGSLWERTLHLRDLHELWLGSDGNVGIPAGARTRWRGEKLHAARVGSEVPSEIASASVKGKQKRVFS